MFANDETLPLFLARTNDEFVRARRQCSPQIMIDLLTYYGAQLDQLWATTDLTTRRTSMCPGPAPTRARPGWTSLGTTPSSGSTNSKYATRLTARCQPPAAAAPSDDTFMRALPHSLSRHDCPEGTAVLFVVSGDAGGQWTAEHRGSRWQLSSDAAATPAAQITMNAHDVRRLATRGITVAEPRGRAHVQGDSSLIDAATSLLAVVA